jgi:3-hydroxyacyl-CoA dehydrogenase
MEQPVRWEPQGAVAVVVIAAPPVNALGAAVRQGLAEALAGIAAASGIGAVVIRGEGRMFSAGADIREFGTTPDAPTLSQVIAAVEDLGKPVVAALHGAALGGGLELALGAHHRIAQAEANLGLPEVRLGLLPGAGGTQRLPRLIGAAAALRMMLSGQPVTAAEALALGLVDDVVAADPAGAALALARDLARAGQAPQRSRDRDEGLRDRDRFRADVAAARAGLDPAQPAQRRIVDCVAAAADLPFDEGLKAERAAFLDLVASPEAAALRAAFLAARQARKAVP